jgi:hypothetical protein
MPVSPLHAQVASVALGAASAYGFALGGGNALLAHGMITRPTQDVDLFTDQEHGVEAAADAVEAALLAAGLDVQRRDKSGGLEEVFPGMGEGLAEWIVTAPGGAQMLLQLAYFDRGRRPVIMDVGPVLDVEDVAGGKVCALAGRIEPRDYADAAAMLERFSPAQLIGFARRLDPGLEGRDFADAGLRLDQMPDRAFASMGLGQDAITAIRQRFASWPRTAVAVEKDASGHAEPAGLSGGPVTEDPAAEAEDPEIST